MKLSKIFIICIALHFISCNTATKKDKKPNSANSTSLDERVEKSEKNKTKIDVFETFGSFDTINDSLYLNIPLPTSKFKIKEIEDISAKTDSANDSLNAIIIRVTDGNRAPHGNGIKTTLGTVVDMKSLNLNLDELKKDKKLLVITLNSVDSLVQKEIKDLRKCIATLKNYSNPEACNDAIRNKTIKIDEDILKPNTKEGSVINSL